MVQVPHEVQAEMGSRFVAGDEDAKEVVYAAHGALIYSYCRRMLDHGRAADVAQEVFVTAWRSRERYRPEAGSLAGWLMRLASLKVIDSLRVDGRVPSPRAQKLGEQHGRTVEEDATRIAERMLLARAIADLPERARETVNLAFFEDLTHVQIAKRRALPLSSVENDFRQSIDHMNSQLGGFNNGQ